MRRFSLFGDETQEQFERESQGGNQLTEVGMKMVIKMVSVCVHLTFCFQFVDFGWA